MRNTTFKLWTSIGFVLTLGFAKAQSLQYVDEVELIKEFKAESANINVVCTPPTLVVVNPQPACFPARVDITSSAVITVNTGVNTTFWQDAAATLPLIYDTGSQFDIQQSGKYYIKSATADETCFTIKPVEVLIRTNPIPAMRDTSNCVGVLTTITYPIRQGVNYFWPATGSQSNTFTALPNNSNSIIVNINDSFGCSFQERRHIFEINIPTGTIGYLCTETTFDFGSYYNSQFSGGFNNYQFLSGPSNINIDTNRFATGFVKHGEYKFKVISQFGCVDEVTIIKQNTNFKAEIIQPTCDQNGNALNNGKIKFIPDLNNNYYAIQLWGIQELPFYETLVSDLPANKEVYTNLGNVATRTEIKVRVSFNSTYGLCSKDTILFLEPSICNNISKGSVGDYVFEDMNVNGIQDAEDRPLRNVIISLKNDKTQIVRTQTTDINGKYLFTNLETGLYYISVQTPSGFLNTKDRIQEVDEGIDANNSRLEDSDSNTEDLRIYIEPYLGGQAKENLTYDFGYYKLAAIGDFIWNDLNRNGIQDVGEPGFETTVFINNPYEPYTYSTTSVNGKYLQSNLKPGRYFVSVLIPKDFQLTTFNAGTDDTRNSDRVNSVNLYEQKVITLKSGQIDTTYDIGLHLIPGENKISVNSWSDNTPTNRSDFSDTYVLNITAFLWSLDINGNPKEIIDTAKTNSNYYLPSFENIEYGRYRVQIPLDSIPAEYSGFVLRNIGEDQADSDFNPLTGFSDIIEFNRNSGEYFKNVSAGFKPKIQPRSSIEGFVFHDLNNNNKVDSLENGIPSVKVILYSYLTNPNGTAVDSVLSDNQGKFKFIADVGTYRLDYKTPLGFRTNQTSSFGFGLYVNENRTDFVNGYYKSTQFGNFVWEDSNGNGIQDTGEKGLPNVEIIDNSTGTKYYTDVNGFFKIENLKPGQNAFTFKAPIGFTPTAGNQGTNDEKDSDFQNQTYYGYYPSSFYFPIVLISDEINTHTDFGFISPVCVGDLAWLDANLNGIQDRGEKPMAGINARLIGLTGDGKPVNEYSRTDSSGIYNFGYVRPGKYKISYQIPPGYSTTYSNIGVDTLDSDITNLQSPDLIITSSVHQLSIDIGLYKYCDAPQLSIRNPQQVCASQTYDITSLNLISLNTGINTTFWQNYEATIPLDATTGPATAIKKMGVYYIKSATADPNCYNTQDVYVTFSAECNAVVKAKLYLEGFWKGTEMSTALLDKNLLPKSQPFNKAPWNYYGTESVTVFPPNVTDWVLLMIQNSQGFVLKKVPAFIRKDGMLIDLNGNEGVPVTDFFGFQLSIHHKSHLAVIPNFYFYSNFFLNLTQRQESAATNLQLKQIGTNLMFYAGDLDGNGIINNLDFNKWKTKAATVNQYLPADIDGNGIVNNLDYNLWTKNRSKVGVYQIRDF